MATDISQPDEQIKKGYTFAAMRGAAAAQRGLRGRGRFLRQPEINFCNDAKNLDAPSGRTVQR